MIKVYLQYLIGNFPKKLLNFAIASALTLSISFQAFLLFLIHYFQYLSVYFFNDLIDRKEDIRRNFIMDYKLKLKENHLLYLGTIHFIVPLVLFWIINPKLAILSSLIVLFGILRSCIRIKPIREITLGFLQLIQILFFGYLLMKLDSLIEHISAILTYSFQYISFYAAHKFEFLRASIYNLISILFLVLSISLLNFNQTVYVFLLLSQFTSILSLYLFKNIKNVSEFRNYLILTIPLIAISTLFLFYSVQQPILYSVRMEFKEIEAINRTLSNTILSILRL